MTSKPSLLFAVLLVLTTGVRATSFGVALSPVRRSHVALPRVTAEARAIPRPVMFREVPGRGLLVRTWVNGAGPFSFAIDTGAGATLLSPRVVDEGRVQITNNRRTSIAGMSGVSASATAATIHSLAIGDSENYLPAKGLVMITSGLPRDIDGVLDPTESFAPLGYVIDIPRHELSAFEPGELPLRIDQQPAEGAVVPWLRESHGRRPFVQLDNGDRALLDTGSNLGLAIRDLGPDGQRISGYAVRDVGGGRVSARRGRPTTVAVGSLMLRNIPTDLISGAEVGAPVLLGLNALRPFRLRFDPVHRLIEITPGTQPRGRD
ncbi:MAG: hypothetical protein DMF60_21565 [Acidobacteria bacterium]|nr:MAG: hypothetical protein DMF60_21565 [Acidobacteriota bacterium]